MRGRRLVALTLALLLVSQAFVAPAAAAGSSTGDGPCKTDFVDVVKYGLTLGYGAVADAQKCKAKQKQTDRAEANVYVNARTAADLSQVGNKMADNQAEAYESALWCRAEAEIVAQLEAGATEAEAKENVTSLIENRTTVTQINLLETWNTSLLLYDYGYQVATANGMTAYDNSILVAVDKGTQEQGNLKDNLWNTTKTYTVANGSEHPYRAMQYSYYDSGGDNMANIGWFDSSSKGGTLYVKKPGSNLSSYNPTGGEVLNSTAYAESLSELNSTATYLKDNAKKVINNTWNNKSEYDGIDSKELLSACSGATFSTDKDSTGYYSTARWALMLSGQKTNVNNSFTVEWNPDKGVTVPGDTSIKFETATGARFTNFSLGDRAIVTGDESFTFEVSNVSVSNATLVITDASGNVSEIPTSDPNADGVYRAAVTSDHLRNAADNSTLDVKLRVNTTTGDTITTESWTWTWDQSGAASITLTGGLNTNWKPSKTSGAFEIGTTYDTANRDSPIYFISNGQTEAQLYTLDNGNFTIVDMRNAKTGEQVNSTTLDDDSQQVVQNTLNKTVINKSITYYKTNEKNFDPKVGSSGSGGLFAGGIGGLGAISAPVLLLAAGALILMRRD